MADQDAAMVRAVLREHGHDVPDRGRLSARDLAAYAQITGSGAGPREENGDGGPAPDYDAGTSEDDFLEADAPPEEPTALEPERKPRRVRTARPAATGLAARLRGGGGGKPKGKRPRHPRVPVDRLIERGWEALARLANPVSPPLARCLTMQAPVAGLLLEDVVKGSVVDRALQPIARAEEKAEKVIALAGPPLVVVALQAAQGLPDEQRAMREAILVPMLRESMAVWVRVAGDKVEEAAARAAEMAPVYEKVDELLGMIFAPPEPAPEPAPEAEYAGAAM